MERRTAPARPELAEQASQFILLERAVEQEYRPLMRAELQRRVDAVAQAAQTRQPACPRCGQPMSRKDTRPVSWLARFGKLSAPVSRFVCRACHVQCSAPAGPAGSGTGAHQRFSGPIAGATGGGGPLFVGGAPGRLAIGSGCRRDGRLACGAAFRASGGGLRRGSQRVSCRQPQPGHGGSECAADRGAQRGWLRVENAGARTEAAPQGRGETASAARRCRRPFP